MVLAQDPIVQLNNITYTINGNYAKVKYASNCSGDVVIPQTVTHKINNNTYTATVNGIMERAFAGCAATSITIPVSVTSISNDAFINCKDLASIIIDNENGVYDSRDNCNAIIKTSTNTLIAGCKNTIIPNTVTTIGSGAFSGCTGLSNIMIPNSVTEIGSSAFSGCSGLTSVTIPNSVTEIGSSAFYDCSGLKNITMPNTIISIGNGAFHQTDWYINQPEGVVYAGKIAYTYKGTMSSSTNISIQEGTLAIAPGAFGNCTGMTSASIPNSVELIGSRAFYNCSNLMIVNIGNSVNSIEDKAFKDCNKLTSVTLGKETPLVINSETFSNSKNAKLYIPYSSKTAYEAADYWKEFKEIIEIKPSSPSSTLISFTDAIVKEICLDSWDADGDRELSIEEAAAVSDLGNTFQNKNNIVSFDELKYFTGLTSISNNAFWGCSNIQNITIPNTITMIEGGAFQNCSSLSSITIPNSVTTIGNSAFYGCSNLSSIAIPNTITSISDNTFYNCSSLSNITIPSSVTTIGNAAFYSCSNLNNLTIPNSVTSIGEAAFSQCSSLIEITIPNSVTEIKTNTFYGCANMTKVTIPNSVTIIGWLAFKNCSSLESITIPNSVTTIVSSAFDGCTSLTGVNIPNSVTYIGEKVFSNTGIFNNSPDGVFYVDKWVCGYKGNMPSETSLILEEGTRGISIGAFRNNSNLSSITIPGSVTCINDDAFYGCNNLTSVTVEMVEPISITSYYTFSNAYNATLYVPAGAKSAYLSADGWKDFKKIIEPPIQFADPNVKDICISKWDSNKDGELDQYEASLVTDLGRAFTENETITSFEELKYFTGITSLDGKFYKCSALKSVIIPVGVTSIGASEFSGCSLEYLDIVQNNATFYSPNKSNAIINKSTHELVKGCKSTIIPDDVTAIGEYAFYGSNGLGDFTIPETITSIGDMAFALCNGLTSINIPSSVTNMGTWVFTRSKDLVSVTISDGVTKISNGAFDGCSSLSFISIPKSITTIGSDTFEDCSSLTSITIPSSVETMMYAFYGCNNLTSVTVERETPVTISEKDFPNRKNATLYVPKGAKTAYERVAYWKEFGCILEQGTVLTENNSIYAEDVSVYIGYTVDLQINMSNEDTFTAYQFDLVLPNGITLAKDEKGKYIVTLSNRHSDNTHQVTIDDIGDNTFRFVCVSLNTSVINGNDGTILTVSLKADGDIAEGELNATIKNVILTTADETKMKPKNSSFTIKTMVLLKGDADGDGEIDVTDVVSTINYIIGNPSAKFNFLAADLNEDGEVDIFDVMMAINLVFSQKNSSRSLTRATSGSEEQAIVKVADDRIIFGVNDASRFTAFQFDVELTNAVELKDVRLNADAHHDLQFVRIGQNTYRVIGISMDNSTLTTNGNDFVELRLSKECDAQISNIVFVTPNETKVHFAGCYVNLTEIRNTTLDQSEEIFDLSGRKIDAERNRLPKGVYIINNKKVVIK